MARRGRAAPRRPSPARSPCRGVASAITPPTISSTRRGKPSGQPTSSTRRANLTLLDLLRSHSFTHASPGASSDRMAPRRSKAQHDEEFFRIVYEIVDQEVDLAVSRRFGQWKPAVSQMHQGPSNPMLTSPFEQQSSCASSVGLPEMDLGHHPVDDITVQQTCELHVPLSNISYKVALGMAYPVDSGEVFHGNKVLPGYSRVRLDEVCEGRLDDLDLVYTEYEGVEKLGEAIHKVILWRKRYIIFDTNCNNNSSSPMRVLPQLEPVRSRSPTPPPAPHKEKLQSPRSKVLVDEAHHDTQCVEDDASADNGDHVHEYSDEDENLHVQCHATAPSVHAINITSKQRNDDAPRFAHDTLVGKDVILYAMLRSGLPVAKGTVISTNPSTVLGGQSLGRQFCQVFVNLLLKRDAFLPRPYAEMETMGDAYMMSIAWPYKKLKVSNKASILPQGTAGTSKRC